MEALQALEESVWRSQSVVAGHHAAGAAPVKPQSRLCRFHCTRTEGQTLASSSLLEAAGQPWRPSSEAMWLAVQHHGPARRPKGRRLIRRRLIRGLDCGHPWVDLSQGPRMGPAPVTLSAAASVRTEPQRSERSPCIKVGLLLATTPNTAHVVNWEITW